MSDQVQTLREEIEFHTGDVPDETFEESSTERVRYLSVDSLRGKDVEYVSEETGETANESDVLMIMDGSKSGEVFTGAKGVISSTMAAVRSDELNSQYLYYVLDSEFDQINAATIGGAIGHTDKDVVRSIEYTHEKLGEQEKIASILYTLDKLIDTTQQLINKLLQVRRATLQDVESLINSEYSMVPIKEVVQKQTSQISSDEQENCRQIGLEHLSQEHRVVDSGSSDDVSSGKYEVDSGDIIFGQIRSYLRKVCISDIDAVCSTDAFVIKPDGINRDYLHTVLSSDPVIKWSIRASVGGKMPRVNWDDFVQFKVPVPSESEQKRIAGVIRNIDDRRTVLQNRVDELESVKQGLMHDLLSGDVRTPETLHTRDEIVEPQLGETDG